MVATAARRPSCVVSAAVAFATECNGLQWVRGSCSGYESVSAENRMHFESEAKARAAAFVSRVRAMILRVDIGDRIA